MQYLIIWSRSASGGSCYLADDRLDLESRESVWYWAQRAVNRSQSVTIHALVKSPSEAGTLRDVVIIDESTEPRKFRMFRPDEAPTLDPDDVKVTAHYLKCVLDLS